MKPIMTQSTASPNVLLYMWGPTDGLPSASPFCLKSLYALRFKKIPHRVKYVGARMPLWVRKGLLPVSEIGESRIEDSSDILRAIDELPSPVSRRLFPTDPVKRAEVLLLEDWADEALSAFSIYYRWVNDDNFHKFANQAFARAPLAMRKVMAPLIRSQAIKRIKSRSVGLNSEEERRAQFEESLEILETRLSRNPFLTGAEPNAADFSVFPHLQVPRAAQMPELAPLIEARPGIMTWMKTMETESRA
jgi:glutathione S-transferase